MIVFEVASAYVEDLCTSELRHFAATKAMIDVIQVLGRERYAKPLRTQLRNCKTRAEEAVKKHDDLAAKRAQGRSNVPHLHNGIIVAVRRRRGKRNTQEVDLARLDRDVKAEVLFWAEVAFKPLPQEERTSDHEAVSRTTGLTASEHRG